MCVCVCRHVSTCALGTRQPGRDQRVPAPLPLLLSHSLSAYLSSALSTISAPVRWLMNKMRVRSSPLSACVLESGEPGPNPDLFSPFVFFANLSFLLYTEPPWRPSGMEHREKPRSQRRAQFTCLAKTFPSLSLEVVLIIGSK